MAFPTPHGTSAASATKLTISPDTIGGATVTYTISNLALNFTDPGAGADSQIDIAHLGQTVGELAGRMDTPLIVPADDGGSGRTITFDYIGKSIVNDGQVGTYVLSVNGSTLIGGTTASYYTVQSSTLTLAVNDVIRGQATLTIAR